MRGLLKKRKFVLLLLHLSLMGVKGRVEGSGTDNHRDVSDEGQVRESSLSDLSEIPSCSGKTHDASLSGAPETMKHSGVITPALGFHDARHFLVSTLDGKLTLLDQRGEEVWAISTGKLFSSTISSLQLSENGKWVNLIPSLTGGLYKYDEENLLPMPINADSLLHKSFKLSNDVVINGGKEMRTLGIDLKTGRLRYDCGIAGCTTPQANELVDENAFEEPVTLVVKKQLQTVRAVDTQSGTEKWNFSVGLHEMGLTRNQNGQNCVEEDDIDSSDKSPLLGYVKVIIPEGRLLSTDPLTKSVWNKKFTTPIVQAWVLEKGRLIYVDPVVNTPSTEGTPALYVGQHDHQPYVQESRHLSNRMEQLLGFFPGSNKIEDNMSALPKIAWKPKPLQISSESEDMGELSTALTPLHSSLHLLRPFYVLETDEVKFVDMIPSTTPVPNSEQEAELHGNDGKPADDNDYYQGAFNFDMEEDGPITIIKEVVIGSLWFWWKEILGISLLTAIVLNILLMRPIVRAVRVQTIREVFQYVRDHINIHNRNVAQDGQPIFNVPAITAGPSDSNSSETFEGGVELPVKEAYMEIQYVSQYLKEFDPIQCLGKGGFGVVFEARKKIDERNYAVKRIPLPNREEARVRVMREVKALAQLDHRHIVRYFNAWIEHPPNGWLEKFDPLWSQCNVGLLATMSPTSDCEEFSAAKANSQSFSLPSFIKPRRRRKRTLLAADSSSIDFSAPVQEETSEEEDVEGSFIVFQDHTNDDDLSAEIQSKGNQNNNESCYAIGNDSHTGSDSANRPGGLWKKPEAGSASWSVLNERSDIAAVRSGNVEVGEEATENISVMYLYIQQELCQKKTLKDWLRVEIDRDIPIVLALFSQIVGAVEYVHSKKLIHRDLKPSNIFLAESSDGGDGHIVKIGDFGLATTVLEEMDRSSFEDPAALVKQKNNLTSQVGTQLYMSPEQARRKQYDYKVDIYSLGLIFFELLVSFSTEMERHEVLSQVRKGRFPSYFKDSYPREYSVIVRMISNNPQSRPDAASISFWVKEHLRSLQTDFEGSGSDHSGKSTLRSNSSPGKIAMFRSASSSADDDKALGSRLSFPVGSKKSETKTSKLIKSHSFTTF